MKKGRNKPTSGPERDDIEPEYDFSRARRNPYVVRPATKSIAVVLDPDVAARFPSAKAVNAALRKLKRNG